ncbi:hypothetical protein [Arenicella xantha]|uniref:Uncharacterized protein n=1 Tax=Arenicella xantha TaxID=644221 RepID=A0A395JES1_9GAMM|nr:hypothetical protein [Arenicella xantha]RBP47032.1 hypothetical protein DFR28_1116 [Arenicella xantha]
MLILELKKAMDTKFEKLDFVYDEATNSISIPPKIPDIGDIVIIDDGDELLTHVGRFTHSHFGCYEDGFTDSERTAWTVRNLMKFLDDLFSDKIVMWGEAESFGGFHYLEYHTEHDKKGWLWSGELGN